MKTMVSGVVAALFGTALLLMFGGAAVGAGSVLPTLTPAPSATPLRLSDHEIAFMSGWKLYYDIYVMRLDGTDLRNITQSESVDGLPSWSPDGRQIAFTSNRSDGDPYPEIYIINADGSGLRQLTDTGGKAYNSAWSPDGNWIAFDSAHQGNQEIYVIDVNGEHQRRLTRHPARDDDPAWSPDGNWIAFTSNRDGSGVNFLNDEIYVMNIDGTYLRNLTQHPAYDEKPAWSPDGTEILFLSRRDGENGVYVMDDDGRNVRALTADLGWRVNGAAWSPDGGYIIFSAEIDFNSGNYELYLMTADGADVQRLTDNGVTNWFPEWRPVPN